MNLLKNRVGDRLDCTQGVVVASTAQFLNIEGSLQKNWDWEMIELNTGGCISVDSTILDFGGNFDFLVGSDSLALLADAPKFHQK